MTRVLSLILVLCLTVFLTGCPKTRTPMPAPIKDKLIENQISKMVTLADDYDKAIADNDLNKAQQKRDALVFLCVALINDSYDTFEDDFFAGRATYNVLGDFVELGLTAVTGFTNGERVKSILGIAATAFKGARKSVDVNFFRERTTEIIAMKMRAARDRVRTNIYKGLQEPVSSYPLGAAIDDLVDYVHAGSINNALIELAQDTGEDGKQAKREVNKAKVSRYLTAGVALEFRSIRTAAEAMRQRLIAPATQAAAQNDLRAILRQLYEPDEIPNLDALGSQDLFDKLQEKIEQSRDNDELRKKLMTLLKVTP